MKIKAFLSESYQDYDGLTSMIFMHGCNLACKACYAKKMLDEKDLLDEAQVLHRLERKKKYINKVTISGGEASLQPDLPEFINQLKCKGFKIKLDTNGFSPLVLDSIGGLVDYIALDVKGPKELYPAIVGKKIEMTDYDFTLKRLRNFSDYELRTTIVPIDRGDKISFITEQEADSMANWISYVIDKNSKWFIQPFTSRTQNEMIDSRFSIENLPREMHRTPKSLLEQIQKSISKYFPKAEIRGG